eukprot:1161050-Pelagomonas_calceolata.AAC.11
MVGRPGWAMGKLMQADAGSNTIQGAQCRMQDDAALLHPAKVRAEMRVGTVPRVLEKEPKQPLHDIMIFLNQACMIKGWYRGSNISPRMLKRGSR